jgi:hypothetical protein
MPRLRWLCGMIICGLLAGAINVSAVAQDKTDPEAKKVDPEPKKGEPEKKAEPKKGAPESKKAEPEKKTEPEKSEAKPQKLPIDPKKIVVAADGGYIPQGFRMFLVADGRFDAKDDRNRVGKLHDPVAAYGLGTVIAVFARTIPDAEKADDPTIAVMKMQQNLVTRYRVNRFGAFTAFLALKKDFSEDDERDKLIGDIGRLAKAAEVPLVSVGLAEATTAKETKEGEEAATQVAPQVAAWGIAPDDGITIVLYHRFKFVKRWKFPADKPPTEADLKEISATVDAFMSRPKK